MQILLVRRMHPVLTFCIATALCVTLVYLHHSPYSEKDAFINQKRDECSPGKSGKLEKSNSQSVTQKAPAMTTVTPKPLPVALGQEDPALAAYIRRLVVPPSQLPYNLTYPHVEHASQLGQTQFLMKRIFPNMKGGFFLEAGAVDGEVLSNTLYLERRMGWRGLLIEANPGSYQQLLQKHRKSFSIQAALSPTNESCEVEYRVLGPQGQYSSVIEKKEKGETVRVRAFPLYAILKALDVPVIDYLSLDIEGKELEVLATVPWDKVKVRVMHVEYNHLPGFTKVLVPAMEARGMHFIGIRSIDAWFVCPELYKNTIQNVTEITG